jgi:hypothetical protein
MFKKFYDWFLMNVGSWAITIFILTSIVVVYQSFSHTPNTVEYKDFKDGIQNHLVWSIKGECFFVRPQTELTVHLVRVADCDKK